MTIEAGNPGRPTNSAELPRRTSWCRSGHRRPREPRRRINDVEELRPPIGPRPLSVREYLVRTRTYSLHRSIPLASVDSEDTGER